jgi:zinc/manganese transport system ATP-binding protein
MTADQDQARPQLLALDGIGVQLGGRQILRDVSFTVRPGEFTGLIGPNGAGKTTLLKVILGLQPPTAGRILLDGRPQSRRVGARRAGAVIGYVPQKIAVDQDVPLRARDVVALGLDGHRLGLPLPSRVRNERVQEALEAVDAERFADARVGELSGGEQQRVLIAHAVISRPRLLLLDEPLANLDLRAEQGIVAVLARLAREQHIGVLISAHDMNPLMGHTDRIVYVAAGKAAAGRTDEVIQPRVLSDLYGSPVDVLRVRGRVIVVSGEEHKDGDPVHHPLETGIVSLPAASAGRTGPVGE